MPDRLAAEITELVGDQADGWDRSGLIPHELLRKMSGRGLLCAQVPEEYGGLGLNSAQGGELTARAGSLCSSLRSVMTSQGMAAWALQRLGDAEQRSGLLGGLVRGRLAAVGFSEADAGSDVTAMRTTIRRDGGDVVVDGVKTWITAARYADELVIFGRYEDGGAVVAIPADTPGVTIEPVPDPLGCRAAGHSHIRLDEVRVPARRLLDGAGMPLPLLITLVLAYGRMSVGWGCVGILRGCLAAAGAHARSRRQFGKPLGEHQLVGRHLAGLLVSEQIATRACEHASALWDANAPDAVTATVLAKHVGATQAAQGAAAAVQILGSAGADNSSLVARAYRDAKLMEIIEGSNELCQVMLAEHVLSRS
ncbi:MULTISPECIES: acyl-CoA dehydrogenase family protein [unclassified Streptomyces]|uniref:acyl-CoA dehydrogenase family protein n=1 Tax=unclassified Streptomyces TaxID=2593676 RepID=UPI000A534486|nr:MULTISPECIES: acyl-CoA dehydrogenase family protein [unclassified Streptomyces]AZM63651.1 acyl-CoA dehydrogenase [Streptomyces sp. WAC 01438]RSM92969.1 acyl-CoA dehydrogenase [Streptomyces sp. WAC 01420]